MKCVVDKFTCLLIRFKWDVKSFAPDFFIFPSEGYITPGMEVSLEVTFAPMVISQDLRYDDLCCTIEGGTTLKLTLTGSCIAPVVATEVRAALNIINYILGVPDPLCSV